MENKIFKVVKWNAIANLVRTTNIIQCSICRYNLEEICPVCRSQNDQNTTCFSSQGACGHSFHKHCLEKWFDLKSTHQCLHCLCVWNELKCHEIKH